MEKTPNHSGAYSFGNQPPPLPVYVYPPDQGGDAPNRVSSQEALVSPTERRRWWRGKRFKTLFLLITTFICGAFNQFQPVSPLVFLFYASFLSFVHVCDSNLVRWLGTLAIACGMSLSMSQIFRLDDGWAGSYWDWTSWGYVVGIEIVISHLLLLISIMHVTLARRRPEEKLIIFCFPTLVACIYSIIANFTPAGTQTSIGYGLYDFQSFIQIVSLFGLTGLNFIILTVASCIAHAMVIDTECGRSNFSRKLGIGIFLINWLFGSIRLLSPYMYQLSVDDTAIPSSGWVNAACVVHETGSDAFNATAELLARDPYTGLVLWSEVAMDIPYYDILYSQKDWQIPLLSDFTWNLTQLSSQYNVTIGATYTTWAKPYDFFDTTQYNDLMVVDPVRGVLGTYSKSHPVPIIESDVVAVDDEMLVGESSTIGKFAAGICFDFDFPYFIRSGIRKEGAGGLLIQTANTWGIVGRFHGISSSFRAIENGAYLVRCGSNGPSGLWDHYGNTLAYQSRADDGVMQFQIPKDPERVWTVYNSFGFAFDYLLYAIGIGYIGILVLTFWKPKQVDSIPVEMAADGGVAI